MKKYVTLACCLFYTLGVLRGQAGLNIDIQQYSTAHGLKDQVVYDVIADEEGLIWVATKSGVYYFDGYTLTPLSVANNPFNFQGVYRFIIDNGEVWCQNFGTDLARLNMKERRFDSIAPLPSHLTSLKTGFVYAPGGIEKRIYHFVNESNFLSSLDPCQRIAPDYELTANNFFIPTTWSTLLVGENDTDGFYELNSDGKVVAIFQDCKVHPNGYTFIEGNRKAKQVNIEEPNQLLGQIIAQLDVESEDFMTLDFFHKGKALSSNDLGLISGMLGITKTVKGYYWLVGRDVLILFDDKRNLIQNFSAELKEQLGESWYPHSLFVDTKDRLWVAGPTGLTLFTIKQTKFTTLFGPDNPNPMRGINQIGNGDIVFHSRHGVFRIRDGEQDKQLMDAFGGGMGMTKASNGSLLLGAHSKKITLLDSGVQTILDFSDWSFNEGIVYPFYNETLDTLYLGVKSELFYFTKEMRNPQLVVSQDKTTNFHGQSINYHAFGKEGLWIAGSAGLFLIHDSEVVDSFPVTNLNIKHFYRETDKVFWLGTYGEGLIRWDREDNSYRKYTMNENLSSDVIYAVYEDQLGYLWLPSNYGLMRFNKQTGDLNIYHTTDGVANEEFNTYSHFQDKRGKLYFGGLKGLTIFDPLDFMEKADSVTLVLTSVQLPNEDEEELANVDAWQALREGIRLKHDQSNFVASFSLLDYAAPEKFYAWRIDGVDQDWNVQRENSLRLNSLPSGRHILQIKAKAGSKPWSTETLNIPIFVEFPFYQRWPFLTAVLSALLMSIYGYVTWRTYSLEKEKKQLNDLVAQRTLELYTSNEELAKSNQTKDRLFAIVAHDLKAPVLSLRGIARKVNFLITRGRFEELQQLGDTVEGAVNQTKNLLDNLLNWALLQRNAFHLTAESIDLLDVANEVARLYKDTADAKNISIEVVATSDQFSLMTSREAIHATLRNLVDNAIKYSQPNQTVFVELKRLPKYFSITVRDQGIGMSKEQLSLLFTLAPEKRRIGTQGEKSTGLGLLICQELIELCGGKIEVNSKPGMGTCFTILLPSQKVSLGHTQTTLVRV